MQRSYSRVGAFLLATLILPAVGCSKPDDGLSSQQQEKTNRLDAVAKQSGGDWEKVSQADRDYLVKELSSGSEPSAKMLLLAKSGKLKAGPGGVPSPGGPPPGGTPR